MKFKILGLIYTYRCNAECEFCCYECAPCRTEKMPLDRAFSLVDEAAEIADLTHLALTGGEAFLYYEDLGKILTRWNRPGRTANIASNGFWASSVDKAADLLSSLKECGLTTLSLSCDVYHQAYVPLERVRNALSAARACGIKVEVNCTRKKGDPHLHEVLPEIAEGQGVFQEGVLVPSGRGASITADEFLYLDELPLHRCGMMNTLAVTPGGTVYPCCSVFGETPGLALGNAYERPLLEVFRDAMLNTLLVLLERQGLGALLGLARECDPGLPVPSRVVNPCHLCHELLTNPRSAGAIARGIETFEAQLLSQVLHPPHGTLVHREYPAT